MNTTKVVSIVVLVVGIVILVVLTTLGGVAKQTIHDSVISRYVCARSLSSLLLSLSCHLRAVCACERRVNSERR